MLPVYASYCNNDKGKKMVIHPKFDFCLGKPESTESPQCCNRPMLILGSKGLKDDTKLYQT